MPKAHDAGSIVPVDLIGSVRGHDVVSASEFLEAETVTRDFIDVKGKMASKNCTFLGSGKSTTCCSCPTSQKKMLSRP